MDSGAANRNPIGLWKVGFDGEGTVNRAQGILPMVSGLYLREMITVYSCIIS